LDAALFEKNSSFGKLTSDVSRLLQTPQLQNCANSPNDHLKIEQGDEATVDLFSEQVIISQQVTARRM